VFSKAEDWKIKPPGNDVYISAFGEAVSIDFNARGEIYEFLRDFIYNKLATGSDAGPSHMLTHLLRAVQRQFRDMYPDYPHDHVQPQKWLEGMYSFFDDADRAGIFVADMYSRELQSNISERAKGVALLAQLAIAFGRFGEDEFTLANIGSSQGLETKHVASGIGFTPPMRVDRPGSRSNGEHIAQRRAVVAVLNQPLRLAYGLNTDRVSIEDGRAWAESCSFYPAELTAERLNLFRELQALDDKKLNIDFAYCNFVEPQGLAACKAKLAQNGRTKVKIAYASTMAYQLGEDERETLYANATEIAEEFVVIQDFIEVDRNNPTRLIFRRDWQDDKRPYRFAVRDLRSERPHIWHEIFLWGDGRCNELSIGTGRLMLGATAVKQYKDIMRNGSVSVWNGIRTHAETILGR
jgi:hypothetical protein